MSQPSHVDPARAVAQPVSRALDSVIILAAASFAISIAAALSAMFTPEGLSHEVAHFALVGLMGLVILARALRVVRRAGERDPAAWNRARAMHRWDTDLARALTFAVPVAWLAGGVTVLVHHIGVLHGPGLVVGVWLPVAAAVWVVASFAWHDFCRDRIADALEEADRKYREYWQDIARPG